MRKVFVEPVVLPEPRFRDGLGIRYVRTDTTDDPVEVLRPLWDVGAMQGAIRQRVGRLASFRQARFVPVRAAEVPRDDSSTIEVISDYVSGHRLSQYLDVARAGPISIETSTAIYIIRELLGALALLHESRGLTHGAIGPERILLTPKGRVVVADYVLGPAIERLEFTRNRLWREFRIPLPAGKKLPRLDDAADVVQVGVTAVALLAGRPLEIAEYPDGLDDLVASIGQARGNGGRPEVPSALMAWLKRALARDPASKFADVREARLALEAVLSKQNAATGGATALKTLAEAFGRHAAACEEKEAAAAAERARKAALAAQAAALEVSHALVADADTIDPSVESVCAFSILSETPASGREGVMSDETTEAGTLAPGGDSDPPVGWRVPETPPVEETLPTSPLLQIDTPAAAPVEEFIEEVLDLTSLAAADDADMTLDDVLAADSALPVGVADEADAIPAAAEMRDGIVGDAGVAPDLMADEAAAHMEEPSPAVMEAAGPPSDLAIVEELPVPAAITDPAPPVHGTLQASTPDDVATGEPEWRLLADPEGANAPTIELEEPVETLDELVAAFAAVVTPDAPVAPEFLRSSAEETPVAMEAAPVVVEEAAIAMEAAPVVVEEAAIAMEAAPVVVEEAPITADDPAATITESQAETVALNVAARAEDTASSDTGPSVLDVILNLQEAQTAAQATVENPTETTAEAPDVRAWSFVEELLHHDARFEARPAAVEQAPEARAAEPAAEPAPAPNTNDEQIVCPAPVADAIATEPVLAGEDVVTALPADWFIDVRPRTIPQAPVLASRPELEETLQGPATAAEVEPPLARQDATVETGASLPPVPRRVESPAPDQDPSEPIFPRVAPSVRRVRAEARRRRLARISSAAGQSVQMLGKAGASGAGAIAAGILLVVSAAGRGTAALFRAILSGGHAALSVVSHGAGVLLRGAGTIIRSAAAGTAALLRGAARGARVVARGGAAIGAAAANGLAASAGYVSKASIVVVRAGGGAVRALAVAVASALGALGKAASAGASVALTGIARGGRAGAAAMLTGAATTGRAAGSGITAVARGARAASAAFGRSAGRLVGQAASAARTAGGAAGRAAGHAASTATTAGATAGRGASAAGSAVWGVVVSIPRKVYFAASDLADHLPKPVFRPWYLGAALLVIVAVAGVPFARTHWFTSPPPAGSIRVESARPDALVTIDGVAQGRVPVTVTVPVGRHRIEVAQAGKTSAHEVDVAADRETIVQAAGADLKGTGSIHVTSDPAGAEVRVDGVLRGIAPVTVDDIAEGAHTLEVRDKSGSVRRAVRVRADESVEAAVQIRPGWLAVFAPVKLDILEDGHSVGSTERGRILASPGVHTLEVVSEALGFRETRQVEIRPGEVAAITIKMAPAAVEIVAPAGAEILVDGQVVGTAPLGSISVAVGTREITMRHPTLGERRQVVSVTYASPARVVFE